MNFHRDDAKIGLLVLLCAGLFLGLLFHRGMTRLVAKETLQYVRLKDAADVPVGTEVLLQGVRVGKVNAVDLQRDGAAYRVTARLGLRPEIVLWKGTEVRVNSRTFGGGFLELMLPPEADRSEVLSPGTTLSSTVAPSLGGAIQDVQTLVRNVNESVVGLRSHLERRGAGALLDHPAIREVLRGLDQTLTEYRTLAMEGQGLLRKSDPALESLTRSLASVEQTVKVLEKRQGDIDAIVGSLSRTLKETEALVTTVRGQMTTTLPETEATLKALHRNLQASEELLELLKQKPRRILWGSPSAAEKEAARKKVAEARTLPASKQ